MVRPYLRAAFSALLAAVGGRAATVDPFIPTPTPTSLALRAANPNMLSGGLFSALDAAGVYAVAPAQRAIRAGMVDRTKGRAPDVLDARVGQNIRVGDDPGPLPISQLGQAEPHIFRSTANSNVLLATFQEGRFSDAGSVDCGYGISADGGLTWTRALIPRLTLASNGPYNRATDPVAAIGPQGDCYLNTLDSISGAFASAAIVVSRSTDNGATWGAPVVVFQSTSSLIAPDKNWLAVNDFPGSANAGRLVVTWTSFTSTASGTSTGSNLRGAYSDDRGATWSVPIDITPPGSINQGSQPVFLPDGTLVVAYVTFPSPSRTDQFQIECKRSTDGGRTFPVTSTVAVPIVNSWDDPDLRDGVFLPSAAVARVSGDLFITYTAVLSGTPRVLVTKSSDHGATWSTPVIASDNPAGSSVANPAVTSTPDGQTVSAVFMDKRNASDGHNFIDIYAALSFDGGATWQPNLRLTDITSDIRFGPLTTRGYMFGDYLAVAPALTADEPCVAIWCDARTGDSDPFTARFTPAMKATYDTWRIANGVGAGTEDPDGDGAPNALEYALATNPRVAEAGEALVVSRAPNGDVTAAIAGRTDLDGQLGFQVEIDSFGGQITPPPPGGSNSGPTPDTPPPAGMSWQTFAYPAAPPYLRIHPYVSGYHDSSPGVTSNTVTGSETVIAGTTSRLVNVSTRGAVGTGASQMIVGFVIDGPKTMLIRAAGPTLAAFGVTDVLADPQLALQPTPASGLPIATNNAWEQSTASAALFGSLGAFPFPAGSSDAAILESLPAGTYTGIVSGANGGTGTALVEAYDADPVPGSPQGARILDLSTRANVVGGGSSTLIAGFVISGSQPRRVLIRAIGPSLAVAGVSGALADPLLSLYRGSEHTPFVSSDDWEVSRSRSAVAATAKRLGAFALNSASLDASLLIALEPGSYTATVTGVNGSTGITLVEVYDAD